MATLAELDDATAFERFALDSATPLIKPQYGWVDLRDRRSVGAGIKPIGSCAGALDELRLELRPLMFGAAWKILDLMVEYALPRPSGRRSFISDKVKEAISQTTLTPWAPFGVGDPEWTAVLRMYAETEELRHGLVHRDVQRNSQTGELEVIGKRGQNQGRKFVMSDDEALAFCRATRRLIEAILAQRIEPRERDDLAFQLAQVHKYSKVPPRTDKQLAWVCEIHADLRDAGNGSGPRHSPVTRRVCAVTRR